MAGDWIKMRTDLADDPSVVAIAEATGLDEDHVVGKLHRLWSWADKHTRDGVAQSVSMKWVDRYLCCDGFAVAMVEAGWLGQDGNHLTFPNFDVHNGQSSKRRAEGALRVREHRKRSCNDSVTQTKRDKVTIPRPLRAAVFERDNKTCVYCDRKEGETYPTESHNDGLMTVDHVYPESHGGDTTLSNLVTCCNCCNRFKANRTPEECGLKWPTDVTGKRYGSVTSALPREEKRREESIPTKVGIRVPKIEQVREYIELKKYNIDAEQFWHYYEARGWRTKQGPLRSWKSAIVTWVKNEKIQNSSTPPKPRAKLLTPEQEKLFTAETMTTGLLADGTSIL